MSRYQQQVNKPYPRTLTIIVLTLLIILSTWFFFTHQQDDNVETKKTSIPLQLQPLDSNNLGLKAGADNKTDDTRPQSELKLGLQKAKQPLPELKNSDAYFKNKISSVSPALSSWFESENIIQEYIILINDLSQNQLTAKHRVFLNPTKKMVAGEDAQGLYLTKESYKRYDRLAMAIAAIDPDKGLQLYLTFKPLFERVFNEFAYPAGYHVEDIFLKTVTNVIEAPVIEDRISLIQHSAGYKFASKELESLSNAKKQMIRMGPENTKKIQVKLRELVQALTTLTE